MSIMRARPGDRGCHYPDSIDALTSPARLVEWFGTAGMPSDQTRKLLGRCARLAAALGGPPGERAKIVRGLAEKVVVDDNVITIRVRGGAVGRNSPIIYRERYPD
jgi:hypothetical protein